MYKIKTTMKTGVALLHLLAHYKLYTDFHYSCPVWQRNTEKDYLIGVSMTGIASLGTVLKLDMKHAAKVVKETNADLAKKIGIKPAARCTTVKPAGTTSLTLGTSSGIHAWHNEHYIRRIRVGKNEPIYSYLVENHPNLVEDEFFRPHDTCCHLRAAESPRGCHYEKGECIATTPKS